MAKTGQDTEGGAAIDLKRDWDMIEAQLPSDWRELAAHEDVQIALDQPEQLGAKVTDLSQVLRLVFYHVGTNSSLRTTTAMGAAAGIIVMSAVGLHKWMRKMGSYIAILLEHFAKENDLFAARRWAGYDIRIEDATNVQRPGSCSTTARVHYSIKLSTLRPAHIEVTDDRGGETYRRFPIQPGQLHLGDRVYANPPGIAWVVSQGADVLVRYNRGALPLYDARGKVIDVLEKVSRTTKPGRAREWAVYVHPANSEVIPGRLCAVRLPPDKAREARERLRKEQGNKVSKKSLQAAAFVMVFTTVPRERLSTERVLELYALRWQVELFIKRDKSIAGLDRLPNFREDTIFTWISTKLLLTEIARKIASPDVVMPPLSPVSANAA